MADSLLRPFVGLLVFFGALMVLLGSLTQLQQSNYVAQLDEVPTGFQALDGLNYTMKEPVAGIEITWADVITDLGLTWDEIYAEPDAGANHVIFFDQGKTEDARGAIWVYIVRNNTYSSWTDYGQPDALQDAEDWPNCIVLAQKYVMHGWFDIKIGVNWRYYAIPFERIVSSERHNISSVSFNLGGDNITAFFMASNESMTLEWNLYSNNSFTMAMGQLWWNDAIGKKSMWKLVGQMLTGSIPDTNWYINAIITMALWSTIAFVAVGMISRFIPTIPGL